MNDKIIATLSCHHLHDGDYITNTMGLYDNCMTKRRRIVQSTGYSGLIDYRHAGTIICIGSIRHFYHSSLCLTYYFMAEFSMFTKNLS
jgi:hypothetical protein